MLMILGARYSHWAVIVPTMVQELRPIEEVARERVISIAGPLFDAPLSADRVSESKVSRDIDELSFVIQELSKIKEFEGKLKIKKIKQDDHRGYEDPLPELHCALRGLLYQLRRWLPCFVTVTDAINDIDVADAVTITNVSSRVMSHVLIRESQGLFNIHRDQVSTALKNDSDDKFRKTILLLRGGIRRFEAICDLTVPKVFAGYCEALIGDDQGAARNAVDQVIAQYPNWFAMADTQNILYNEGIKKQVAILLQQIKKWLPQYAEITEPDGQVKLICQQQAPVAAGATFVAEDRAPVGSPVVAGGEPLVVML